MPVAATPAKESKVVTSKNPHLAFTDVLDNLSQAQLHQLKRQIDIKLNREPPRMATLGKMLDYTFDLLSAHGPLHEDMLLELGIEDMQNMLHEWRKVGVMHCNEKTWFVSPEISEQSQPIAPWHVNANT